MAPEPKSPVGVSHAERRGSATEIREVQNVALADATAKSGVSAWTPAMFRVRATDGSTTAWLLSLHVLTRRSSMFAC